MARLFILIRRKGSKRFLGAIPTRKGATMASLRRVRIKGFVFKIVTEKQLRRIILKQRPRVRRLKGRRGRRFRRVKRSIKRLRKGRRVRRFGRKRKSRSRRSKRIRRRSRRIRRSRR